MATHAARHRRSARETMLRAQHRKRQVRFVLLALGALVILAGSGWVAADRLDGDSSSPPTDDPYAGLPVDGTSIGDPNAPAILVEYGDYYCSHCADFAIEHEPQLIQDYVRTGKLRYEFRPMPVLGGDLTDPANPSVRLAEASYAALAQGAYWPFHHAAFERTTAQRGTPLTDDDIIAIAADIVPDPDRFRADLANGTWRQQVLDTYNQGMTLGMTGVPSFFLNGTPVTWTGDYDTFRATLETALA